jgi:hypothetical protein
MNCFISTYIHNVTLDLQPRDQQTVGARRPSKYAYCPRSSLLAGYIVCGPDLFVYAPVKTRWRKTRVSGEQDSVDIGTCCLNK